MKATILVAVLISALTIVTAGRIDHGSRIVGGDLSKVGDYPSLVSVLTRPLAGSRQHLCGGIIVNDNHVLTTASCVYDRAPIYTQVMGAGVNLGGTAGFEEFKNVRKIFIHESFDNKTDNDLAILRLSHNFVFVHGIVEPATLPAGGTDLETGTPVTLAGWGLDGYEGISNLPQRKLNGSYISNAECQSVYGDSLNINNGCIVTQSGQGVCDGDEGGSVLAQGVTVAMVAWNVGCDAYPAVITQLAPYVDWIVGHFDS